MAECQVLTEFQDDLQEWREKTRELYEHSRKCPECSGFIAALRWIFDEESK